MPKTQLITIGALSFSLLVPALGHVYLGPLYAFLFLIGYLGGFLLWIFTPQQADWRSVKMPYWLTMAAFLFLHKLEENQMAFFETVSNQITGDPVPPLSVDLVLALLVIPLGAWVLIPTLIKRSQDFGYYLAWTFFASMALTELAHFFMPLLAGQTYEYFPGMASASIVAPLGWWGMWRLRTKPSSAI